MKPHWILIANASRARLLQQEQGGPMQVLKAFDHPASRLRSSTLGDDKAGRELSGHGFGGAAFEPRMDAQLREHLRFARDSRTSSRPARAKDASARWSSSPPAPS